MVLKRLLIIVLGVSGFGSMQAMDMVDPTFKELLERALVDHTAYKAFQDYYRRDTFDVDDRLIEPGKTVGQFINEGLVNERLDKVVRRHKVVFSLTKEALAVAKLVYVKRSDKPSVTRTLYKGHESGLVVLDELEDWVEYARPDVDKLYYDPAKRDMTIGEHLTKRLQEKATRREAIKVADILYVDRSNYQSVLQTLYKAYENDLTALEDLHYWFDLFLEGGEDIDAIDFDPARPGKTIGERVTERLSTNEHRKEALAFAKLAQGVRSRKNSVLVTLFKAYEKDSKVFADLREWQEFVQADSSKIYYDSAKKITIAQRVAGLKRDDVTNIFKLSKSAPSDANAKPKANADDAKKAKWSMSKKAGIVGALIAGAGLLYYYMNYKDPKNTISEKPQTLIAAA